MKQLLQNIKSGQLEIVSAPDPVLEENTAIIKTSVSLISAGTERMLVDFAKSNYLQKAKQQPEKVKEVLNKVKKDGLLQTINAVQSKLEQPMPLGYSNVGKVIKSNITDSDLKIGDRVISNGPHADCVRVSKNLISRIPDSVKDDEASFAVLASIGLQGVRLAKPTIGEKFTVFGAGLIGLLTIQILKANGCDVLAIDVDKSRLDLAKKFGATICDLSNLEDPLEFASSFSNGNGIDGVLITASSDSNEIISQSANMLRKKGRIILVGITGLKINRSDFYEKEISFQVSCSYGPGRYDPSYEEKGIDYPIGYVRWTEKRNIDAVLRLMEEKKIITNDLISHRYKFEDAAIGYDALTKDKKSLGIILEYKNNETQHRKTLPLSKINFSKKQPVISFIGAGNYGSRILIPAFKTNKSQLNYLCSVGGVNSAIHGRKFKFKNITSDTSEIFNDIETDTVVIATRHNLNSSFVINGIKSKKNIWVEKPLAINMEEHNNILKAYKDVDSNKHLMVGYNRRFSKYIQKIKSLIDPIQKPKALIFNINAGFIDSNHWTQDIKIGGGRIVGEACHFIDLSRHLIGHQIKSYTVKSMTENSKKLYDHSSIILEFEDGSISTINYLANGAQNFPKERIEIFVDNKILYLENFNYLKGYGWKNFKRMRTINQDKGNARAVKYFLKSLQGDKQLIPINEIFEVSEVTLKISEILLKN